MKITTPFAGNIEKLTLENTNFRHVIYTAPHSQLVLMSIEVGGEIGTETHATVDQFFRFESGTAKAVIAGKEYDIADGSAVIVPAGVEHNFINTGTTPLKLYSIYSPAHHIDGRIHKTKADADADVEDEAFGNA